MICLIDSYNLVDYSDPPSYDTNAKLFSDTIFTNEGISLLNSEKVAINNFVKRAKGLDPGYANFGSSAIWDAGILFCPNRGGSLATAKYNVFDPTILIQNYFGGITYDPGYGVKGNGVNGGINSQVAVRNYTTGLTQLNQEKGLVGIVYKDTVNASRRDFGNYGSNVGIDGNMWLTASRGGVVSPAMRYYTHDENITIVPANTNGHWCLKGTLGSPNLGKVYYNKTLIHTSNGNNPRTAAQALSLPNAEILFLCLNFNSRAVVNYANATDICHYVLGDIGANIGAWNDMIEDFCIETGTKTW
jgi:hypothetical protein